MGRLKLLTKSGELRPPFDDDDEDTLGQWVDDHIPHMPPGQLCESQVNCGPPPASAASYVWIMKGDHVCFTYVCYECQESYNFDEPVDPADYPTTDAGYAVAPTHCTTEAPDDPAP